MNEINYTTPKEQISKLKSQNLIIENEKVAEQALELFGYSNLIKSYREPYTITVEGKKMYRSGTTFNQLFSLYLLDKNLRNAVMAAMIDLEEHIKETSADVIASSFGTHPDEYLHYANYRNKTKRLHRFSLSGILETMRNTLDTDKDPIHHYYVEHGIVPPWILFKSIYFTTIVNFIEQFKKPQQNEMVNKLYNAAALSLDFDSLAKLMMDTLSICKNYRNLAAHGGRIYNYTCGSTLRTDEIFGPNRGIHVSGFSTLLFVLQMLKYQNPFNELEKVLTTEVNRHCQQYPQDVTYLGQILNIDITSHTYVYICETSSKYHKSPHCSGIKNAKRLELDEAQNNGYKPCKRCFKHLNIPK